MKGPGTLDAARRQTATVSDVISDYDSALAFGSLLYVFCGLKISPVQHRLVPGIYDTKPQK